MSGARLAVVVKGFPRLSETFVARELFALEARGFEISLHALRKPGTDAALAGNPLQATPQYLPEYLSDAPALVLQAFRAARRLPGFKAAWKAFRADLAVEFAAARVRRFGQACVLAMQMPATVRHVYAHFLHSPASVARYAALMRGIGFSASAHAKDIWTTPDWDLRQKIREACFVTVCNRAGHARLQALAEGKRIELVHHGVARELIAAQPPVQQRDGTGEAVRIVTVARAVEKKGLRRLLEALAMLPPELAFRLDHFGGGELLNELKERTAALGLQSRICWHGPRPQREVLDMLDRSDLFVLPAVVGNDGDRDGIPNALLEAQARGLAVIATRVGGIDEAVNDGSTGLLVQPGEPKALAHAIVALARDPVRRSALGQAALAQVRSGADAEQGYDRIAALLRQQVGD